MTMHDLRTRCTRRRLLAGMGALSVAITSPVWRVASAFGQDARRAPARRFIGMFSANGTIASAFFPAGSAKDLPLSAATLPRILKPLDKHISRLSVLKGVHMSSTVEDELGVAGANKPGGPHMKGPGAMLTGARCSQAVLPALVGPRGGPTASRWTSTLRRELAPTDASRRSSSACACRARSRCA